MSVLLGHHGHMKDTDSPIRSSQGLSAVPEMVVTGLKGPGTAPSERAGCRPEITGAWDGRQEH